MVWLQSESLMKILFSMTYLWGINVLRLLHLGFNFNSTTLLQENKYNLKL